MQNRFDMIAAIGAFDGFHLGHRTLLDRARELASEFDTAWGIVTFERHPDNLLGGPDFRSLFLPEEQALLQEYHDVPAVHRIMFTQAVANMLPQEFLDHIALRYGVSGVVVGEDFRFGRERSGTLEVLRGECARRKWSLDVMALLLYDGEPVSSSRIRDAVVEGDMRRAWEMLGYPFFCRSKVVRGDRRGHSLGFPTANLEVHEDKISAATGVYATLAFCEGAWRAGAANLGYNPTFEGERDVRFEVNLLDYEGDLYDRTITVFILQRVRDEKRFYDVEALRRQMASDVEIVRKTAQEALASHGEMWRRFAQLGSCSASSSVL